MELYIARHGETEFNVERRSQGSGKDSPLTPNGIEQAKALGKSLTGITFDAVYSSPLKRASDTVEIAFDGKHKPILDPRLVEIGLGKIEGILWDDAMEIYPEASKLFTDPPNYIPPPNGEPLYEMIGRISAFLDDVAKTGYKKVFVLTHGYALRVFHACTTGKTLEALGKARRSYNNCEVVRYQYEHNKWDMLEL